MHERWEIPLDHSSSLLITLQLCILHKINPIKYMIGHVTYVYKVDARLATVYKSLMRWPALASFTREDRPFSSLSDFDFNWVSFSSCQLACSAENTRLTQTFLNLFKKISLQVSLQRLSKMHKTFLIVTFGIYFVATILVTQTVKQFKEFFIC